MMLSEFVRQASTLLEKSGDMKVYIGDDNPTNPLWRPKRILRDAFCPECGTGYCEVDVEEAPNEYFEDNPCC